MPSTSIIAELRRCIRDTKRVVVGLAVGCTDAAATLATLELTNQRLILTVAGGTARGFDIDLADPRFDTVGKLHQQLQRMATVSSSLDREADEDHSTLDFESFGPVDVRTQAVSLRHHVFSDWELREQLVGATRRHNPSLSPDNLPPAEVELVLAVTQARIARIRAGDAAKRKGTDSDAATQLSLASSFEQAYEADRRRVAKALTAQPEALPSRVGSGDVVQGQFYRRSPRNGYVHPLGVARDPFPVPILDAVDGDAEDTNVRVRWAKSGDHLFHSYELWMDTQPDVHRERESLALGGLVMSRTDPVSSQGVMRPSTSRLVFRAYGASSNRSVSSYGTFLESYGQNVTAFNVAALEPVTDYYFRLYVMDLNGVAVASAVAKARTLELRVRFLALTPPAPVRGPAGTVVTVTFDPAYAAFTADATLLVGGVPVTPTSFTATQAVFVMPSFVQKVEPKDIVVVSRNGLKDILHQWFTVTAT